MDRHLKDFDAADLWGIGPRYAHFLKSEGGRTGCSPTCGKAPASSRCWASVASRRRQSLLGRVYKPGFVYHKAGSFLGDIVPESEGQQSVPEGVDDERRLRATYAADASNRRHGRNTVRPLSPGARREWGMRRQKVSPRYTTRIDEVLKVKAREVLTRSAMMSGEVTPMRESRQATPVTLTEAQRERLELLTAECVAAVEQVLASADGDEGEAARFGLLRLVPPPAGERQPLTPDPELKRMIDEMRSRLSAHVGRGGLDAGGKDAA